VSIPLIFVKRLALTSIQNVSFQYTCHHAMSSATLNRARKRTKHSPVHGEGLRALVVAGLGTLILLAFFVAGVVRYSESTSTPTPRPSRGASNGSGSGDGISVASSPHNKAAHRLGSILFVPEKPSLCEERQFDNFTGEVVSSDLTDCEARLEQEQQAAAESKFGRMQGILNGFKK
jgi:hypothetical protein